MTGAGGFIGSHLVELLVRAGYTTRAMIRYTSDSRTGNLALLPAEITNQIDIYRADLQDSEAVSNALAGMDAVFHLGAVIAIPYSYEHPNETVDINVGGTLNVLQAMRRHQTACGVIVSTSEVYGTAQYVPIDEKHPLQPQSPYSASKIGAETLAMSFNHSYNLPIVIVRPFNTFGPRQSARAVIPTIISQALTKDTVLLGAIHTTRDYTYAEDTARGLMQAAQHPEALGKIVNLGTGISNTIGGIADRIIELIGRPVTIIANESERMRPQASEVLRLESDNRLAAQLIDWRPQYTFDDGLQKTINWMREHIAQFDAQKYVV